VHCVTPITIDWRGVRVEGVSDFNRLRGAGKGSPEPFWPTSPPKLITP
jgi:hypothetical protein